MAINLSQYSHILYLWSQPIDTDKPLNWHRMDPLYIIKGNDYKEKFELHLMKLTGTSRYRSFVVDLEKTECLMGSVEIKKEVIIGVM